MGRKYELNTCLVPRNVNLEEPQCKTCWVKAIFLKDYITNQINLL